MEEIGRNEVEQTEMWVDAEESLLPRLPEDVITQRILPLVPIKPLTQFKLVSKEWYSLISSSEFILNHFKLSLFFDNSCSPIESLFIQHGNSYYLYSVNDDGNDDVEVARDSDSDSDTYRDSDSDEEEEEVDDGGCTHNLVKLNVDFNIGNHFYSIHVVGSSNGLICLAESGGKFFILWNPATNVFHKFYAEDFDVLNSEMRGPYCNWGFGYVSSLDDYKTVRLFLNCGRGVIHYTACVYSLKLNRWKKIEFDLEKVGILLGRPKVVNETVYWTMDPKIVAFDLLLETFYIVPNVSMISGNERLCVLGGCLAMWATNSRNDLLISICKGHGNMASVRLLSDAYPPSYDDLIGFTKTNKIIVTRYSPRRLELVVDPTSKKCRVIFEKQSTVCIEGYVPTQVSPIPIGELPNASAQVPEPDSPKHPNVEDVYFVK